MPAEVQDEPEVADSRRMDPEILTISRIIRMLDDLDTDARARVVTYLSSRYKEQPR